MKNEKQIQTISRLLKQLAKIYAKAILQGNENKQKWCEDIQWKLSLKKAYLKMEVSNGTV